MTGEAVLLASPGHDVDPTSVETQMGDWLQLVRAEYLEMPGLHLTSRQAQRLWNLDAEVCDVLFGVLIAERFLKKTPGGAYARSDDGPY